MQNHQSPAVTVAGGVPLRVEDPQRLEQARHRPSAKALPGALTDHAGEKEVEPLEYSQRCPGSASQVVPAAGR